MSSATPRQSRKTESAGVEPMKEIRLRESGEMVAGRFVLTATGLEINGEPTLKELEECGKILARMEQWTQWLIGDWANAVPKDGGEHKQLVKNLCATCGFEARTVYTLEWVCEKVASKRRFPKEKLSFAHHREVAPLDTSDQIEWLQRAIDENLSVADFRKELRNWQRQKSLGNCGEIDSMARIELGDFREKMEELGDSSVSLIFTDPPYDEESIELYAGLAEIASRKLVDGGSLLSYVGHYAVDRVLGDMKKSLRFWWLIAIEHSGSSARLPGKWVFVEWKPILWFVRSGRSGKEYVADLFRSEQPDKEHHDWEQDTSEAEYYIEQLTKPGELVVDPFLGGGTTGIAALNTGRQFWGCEIDPSTKKIAEHRLAGWKCPG